MKERIRFKKMEKIIVFFFVGVILTIVHNNDFLNETNKNYLVYVVINLNDNCYLLQYEKG